jgi:hypothetical protein
MSTETPPSRLDRLRARLRDDEPPPAGACPNCGAPVDDRFCPRCGQRNATRLVSLGRLLRDVADDQLSLSSALPRTLGALARPGRLSAEYRAGRIARYVPPFRLFLIASVLFFIVLSLVTDPDAIWRETERALAQRQASDEGRVARVEGDTLFIIDSAGGRERASVIRFSYDTSAVPGWLQPLSRRVKRQEAKLNALSTREGLRLMLRGTEETAAKAVFVLVPVFAAILKLLYVRRKRLYVEHFVFSLHLHVVAFIGATAALLAGGSQWIWLAGSLGFAVYLWMALRRCYGQGWAKTTLKLLLLSLAYLLILSLVLTGVMFVTLMRI